MRGLALATGIGAQEATVDMGEALSGTRRVTLVVDEYYGIQSCVHDFRCAKLTP